MLVTQLCLTLCDPADCSLPGSSVHGNLQGKYTGVGNHFFLQGIFSTQGSNISLLHCRQILYHLSHQGSPIEIGPTAKLCCKEDQPVNSLAMCFILEVLSVWFSLILEYFALVSSNKQPLSFILSLLASCLVSPSLFYCGKKNIYLFLKEVKIAVFTVVF